MRKCCIIGFYSIILLFFHTCKYMHRQTETQIILEHNTDEMYFFIIYYCSCPGLQNNSFDIMKLQSKVRKFTSVPFNKNFKTWVSWVSDFCIYIKKMQSQKMWTISLEYLPSFAASLNPHKRWKINELVVIEKIDCCQQEGHTNITGWIIKST